MYDVVQALVIYGFSGRAVNERRSFARVGQAQFDPSVSLVDDPVGPDAVGLPFDVEGTAKRRLALVSAGVTVAVMHDRRTGAEIGAPSTGHAVTGAGEFAAWRANLRLCAAGQESEPAVTEAGRPGPKWTARPPTRRSPGWSPGWTGACW